MKDDPNSGQLPSTSKLLSVAHEVHKRLLHWHFSGDEPIWIVDAVTAFDVVGYRFRRNVTAQPNPPAGYTRLLPFDQGPLVPIDQPYPETWERMKVPEGYEQYDGIAVEVPPSLTDHSATWQWMGVFLWTLDQFPSHPAVDYIRAIFDEILELRMYLRTDAPGALRSDPERPYCMAGRPMPTDLLDRFVNAVEKLHDLVISSVIDLRELQPGKSVEPERVEVPPARLVVDLAALTATEAVGGVVHSLKSQQAARWIKVLAENEGRWITSTQLVDHDPELDGVRTDRLLKSLPPKLKRRIETSPHTGSRFIAS